MDIQSVEVIVKAVLWVTDSSGKVGPLLEFDEVELDGDKVCRASAYNAKYVIDHWINENAVVSISRLSKGIPLLDRVIKLSSILPTWPKQCSACETILTWKEDHLFCPSLLCPVKEHTLVFKLILTSGLPVGTPDLLIQTWLEKFPILGGMCHVEIKDIRDFLSQFKQAGPKTITPRLKILQESFGKYEGSHLHHIEKKIEFKLKEGIRYQDFWYIQNLPNFKNDEILKLKHINPLNTTFQKLEATGINSKALEILAVYQDRWIEIANFWSFRYPIIES